MTAKGYSLGRISDVRGLRIIVDSKADCYRALRAVEVGVDHVCVCLVVDREGACLADCRGAFGARGGQGCTRGHRLWRLPNQRWAPHAWGSIAVVGPAARPLPLLPTLHRNVAALA